MYRTSRFGWSALVAVATLIVACEAQAQNLTRGPFIQNPDALTTTMTITWWTDVTGDSTVEYGITAGLGSSKNVATAGSCEVGGAGTCHKVTLTGLLAGTKYFYRLRTNGNEVNVIGGGSALGIQYFQTLRAPSDTGEILFTVIGDFGQASSGENNVANNQNAVDPPLLLTVGDNAYSSGTQSDWDNNALVPAYENQLLRRALFMTTLGNHDLNDVGPSNWASSVEIKMFNNPTNAPAGNTERYYSFDHGDAHFVVLDANSPAIGATQDNWLDNDLATTTRKWKFVFLHQTPYSCANGIASIGSDGTVRSHWGPIFERRGVDIVFTGHDHIYEKSKLVDDYLVGGGSGSDGKSTRYVMTGGGGASLDSAANSDSGGPYRQPLFGSKSYCPWLANDCTGATGSGHPAGVGGQYCSYSRFQHVEVRLVSNTTLTMRAVDQNNAEFDSLVITKVCGNGTVETGEPCDQGAANGTAGSCCTADCEFASSTTPCRASTGTCDVAENCTGTSPSCPVDGFASSTTSCRGSAGTCDVAESCTGTSPSCPADTFASATTECRASVGECDAAENCTGTSATCPPDSLADSTVACRGPIDTCDQAETCTGTSTTCPPDVLVPNGTPCRAVAGICDAAEACTGTNPSCPPDYKATSVCRAAEDVCDQAELCDGASNDCPPNLFLNGTECRAAAGPCDLAEVCTGAGVDCPSDAFAPSTAVCRGSAGVCDLAEKCSGSSAGCPADAKSTASCRASAGTCDVAESCNGVGNDCPADQFVGTGTSCRVSAGVCDVAETCTGTSAACPANGFVPSTTVCRGAADTCDVAESCTGTSAGCPADGFVSSTTVCRAPAATCDAAERCTGTGAACPADALASSTTVCRASTGACDPQETCTGSLLGCPADALATSTTVCRPSAGTCDLAESCTGTSAGCPADQKSTTVCRAAAGVCDVVETCDGVHDACPANVLAATTQVCRPGVGQCDVAESCTGTSPFCPANAFATSTAVCRAAVAICDQAETCTGTSGACPVDARSTNVCRPAASPCDIAESCNGSSLACPADVIAPSTVICRAAGGVCDIAESCTGTSNACPTDAKLTTLCRAAIGVCDVAESCNGVDDDCPTDAVAGSGLECRAPVDQCDTAESCNGTSNTCPADTGAPDGDNDGVCDNLDDCPANPDPSQDDADNDGRGTACDPCNNIVPVAIQKGKLVIRKPALPTGDDRLSFRGSLVVPTTPSIDPLTNGVRVLVDSTLGTSILDATLPGQLYTTSTRAGWLQNSSGTSWTYRNSGSPTPRIAGIYKVKLRRTISTPGLLKFSLSGKNGAYPASTADLPVKATLVIDTPNAITGQCGEATFPGGPPHTPTCTFNSAGTRLKCK